MKNIVFSFIFTISLIFYYANAQTSNVDVKHYEINLNINNIITNGHIGYTNILFDISSKTDRKVTFYLQNQQIDSIYTGNQSINCPPQKTDFTFENNKITITLPDYDTKENYIAIIYYHGSSSVEQNLFAWGGLHYDKDIIYSMGVAFADYPHSYARSWFACNESFSDKATYDIYISVNKDVEAFCSGKFIDKEENTAFDTYHYSIPQNISPYLVAITIGKFFTYEKTIHSNTYNYDIPLIVKYIYAQDSSKIAHNFNGIEKAFNTLESRFGKFRFNRIGYSITPKGSMEHVDNISLSRNAILDTSINGVSNIVHELGHSWFGNLVTCQTAEDMWLNEGWTTYTTRLTLEAIYGTEEVKNYWRKKHLWVLEWLPLLEGIRSVTPIDSTLTYSSTVYEKGAMITKNIQEYFGDEIFFPAVKAMLDSFAFKNYNSYQVRDFLTSYTDNNKFKDFFNNLVFEDKQINYDLYYDDFNGYKLQFNYPEYDNSINIPITTTDDFTTADLDEEFMTLNTNNILVLDTIGLFNASNTYSQIKVKSFANKEKSNLNKTSVRSILHWCGPNQKKLPEGIEKISQQHYWTLQCNDLSEMDLEFKLFFDLDNSRFSFDSTLIQDYLGKDSLILLFRMDCKHDWTAIPFTMVNSNKGYISTSFVRNGDYAMAKGDKSKIKYVGFNEIPQNYNSKVKVYPNPTENTINIEVKDWQNTYLTVHSTTSNNTFTIHLNNANTLYKFSEKGTYVLQFKNKNFKIAKTVIIL